jgi:SAM-dependent methyltransferase
MPAKQYDSIVSFCESCLERFGDNYLGVGWTKGQSETDTRYRVMLDVIKGPAPNALRLLDFGCGASHLYEYILRNNVDCIEYSGLDISTTFIRLSQSKFPHIQYYHLDILENASALPRFDYIIMNGVFTAKCELSFDAMFSYFQEVLVRVFAKAHIGVGFNVTSKQVDWERDDLFHLPFDTLASFLTKHISRNFVFRHDYGLYEYTTYVYR